MARKAGITGKRRASSAPIRVGVAGWDYADWKGILYPNPLPRGFDRLGFLARLVPVIEVNSSFYGPPTAKTARRWLKRVEEVEDFRFAAKLWQRFSHQRRTPWTREEVAETKRGLRVLLRAGRLDALVAQFPWSFRNVDENREWLDDVRRAFEEFPLVVEVRHASWNEPDVFGWLQERGVGFVNVDQPRFKRSIGPSAHATSHVGYIRVHGRNYSDWFRKNAGRDARYDYLYSVEELHPWVARAKEIASEPDIESVDVVFNNHYHAQAVVNALQFQKLLGQEEVSAPPLLAEHFGEALSEAGIPVQG
ncbi:MAG TPA: DUF72 domain-containing protein [Longimicrobiaceae bacterium]